MPPFAESSTLPRDFRFHYQDGERPKTPETSTEELRQPSPPRQNRMKLRRRNIMAMNGPTEQFLASVAAADIPLPTIEVPDGDEEMIDRSPTPLPVAGFLAPQQRSSPPKTPLPQIDTGLTPGSLRRRDWYCEETPEETSRPSSALSDPSNWSDDSYYGSRRSRLSEDGSCTSPDSDFAGPTSTFSTFSKAKGNFMSSFEPVLSDLEVLNVKVRSKTRKDACWTKDMSDHLWSIYQLYLQDPTVTPFRMGASSVPPEGVVIRVSREAKRSWKGPKATRPKRRVPSLTIDTVMGIVDLTGLPEITADKSDSLTPTDEKVGQAYPKWPHSSAATRNHLRELCKKDCTGPSRRRFLQSRSPTPFTQEHYRTRHRTPNSAPHTFSTQDIALSLATSSADSMQPDGPLAQLADKPIRKELASKATPSFGNGIAVEPHARRLGSPFSARTYGPSSSGTFNSLRPSPRRAQPDTVREPRLRSPVNFSKPHSLNATMKRRAQYSLDEELSPTGGALRPTILDAMLFRNPDEDETRLVPQRRVRSRGFTLGDEGSQAPRSGIFPAETETFDISTSTLDVSTLSPPTYTTASHGHRHHLGSPFEENSTSFGSNTFPRRLFSPNSHEMSDSAIATIRHRHGPFATMGSHDLNDTTSFGLQQSNNNTNGTRVSLQEKLSGLQGKLREIHGKRR